VLAVQLQAADKLLARDPPQTASLIANCRQEARAALDELRRSVDIMRRSPLEDRPLDEALRQLVSEFDQRSSVAASFARDGEVVPLAPAAATTLYRTAQEGLTNAQKYAAASRVTVTLTYAPSQVRLTVRNEGGVTPDPTGAASGGGF